MAKNHKQFHTKYTEAVQIEEQLDFNTAECVELRLFGYRKKGSGPFVFTTVQEVDQIKYILLEEISGDEIITIKYKNGEYEKHDSSNCRCINFYDGSFIYDTKKEINDFIYEHLNKRYK